MKRNVFVFLILLLIRPACFGFDVLILPEKPRGGDGLFIEVSGSKLYRHELIFKDKKYRMFYNGKGKSEIFLPLGIEEEGNYKIKIRAKFLGVSLRKKIIDISIGKRRVKEVLISSKSEKMRDAQPMLSEQNEEVLENIRYVSDEKYWSEEFVLPIQNPISGEFAVRRKGKKYSYYHKGIDFDAPLGTEVRAINRGKIIFEKEGLNVYGNALELDHGQGVVSVYFHLDKAYKKEGDVVEKGEVIAVTGSSGWSSAPHLHLGTYIQGKAVDPLWLIETSEEIGMNYQENNQDKEEKK